MFCPQPTLIDTTQPIFEPEDSGLEHLVHGDMGDPDALLSTLDFLLNTPLSAIANDISALDTLDALLATASFTKGAFDAAVINPLIVEYATASVSGDALVLSLLTSISNPPSVPPPPSIPAVPPLTVEILCGPCVSAGGGGGGGGTEVIPPPLVYCPGYGYIHGPCIPPDTPPAPSNTPIPPGNQGCLNPSPGGGFVPGPCPQEPPPPPESPPEPPPQEPPAPPEPPPEPGDGGGDGGSVGDGGGDGGGYCFAQGTLIHLADDIVENTVAYERWLHDDVYVRGRNGPERVKDMHWVGVPDLVDVVIAGEVLSCSRASTFLNTGTGVWMKAWRLTAKRPGGYYDCIDGPRLMGAVMRRPGSALVLCIELAGPDHQYAVGGLGVWTHNIEKIIGDDNE